jgi:hypothetical protein
MQNYSGLDYSPLFSADGNVVMYRAVMQDALTGERWVEVTRVRNKDDGFRPRKTVIQNFSTGEVTFCGWPWEK